MPGGVASYQPGGEYCENRLCHTLRAGSQPRTVGPVVGRNNCGAQEKVNSRNMLGNYKIHLRQVCNTDHSLDLVSQIQFNERRNKLFSP